MPRGPIPTAYRRHTGEPPSHRELREIETRAYSPINRYGQRRGEEDGGEQGDG